MPNLINTDSAGNTFYNYITPVVFGLAGDPTPSSVAPFLAQWQANGDGVYSGSTSFYMRFNNELENTTAALTSNTARVHLGSNGRWPGYYDSLYTGNSTTSSTPSVSLTSNNPFTSDITGTNFMVINNYAICIGFMNAARTSTQFLYCGYLREPSYTGLASPRGFIYLRQVGVNMYRRPQAENTSAYVSLASAADSITTPQIVCSTTTLGADATDIVIRDAAAPHNPVGKLYNCIQLPATCNVGELWRNVGVDADGGNSEQDVYLCVMPWGTAKLGMRVWTENVN